MLYVRNRAIDSTSVRRYATLRSNEIEERASRLPSLAGILCPTRIIRALLVSIYTAHPFGRATELAKQVRAERHERTPSGPGLLSPGFKNSCSYD